MGLDATKCPRCNTFLNGAVCSECETNIEKAETVICRGCKSTLLKSDAKTRQYSPDGIQVQNGFFCDECY